MYKLRELIGQRIREYRKKKNLTQKEVAEEAGLHFSYIAHIELGSKICSLKSLEKIANALNVSTHLLMEQTEKISGYDAKTRKLISLIKDRSNDDKDFLINFVSSLYKRDEKVYK
jgi:transcriptional regulator with XRE-family HTH domain